MVLRRSIVASQNNPLDIKMSTKLWTKAFTGAPLVPVPASLYNHNMLNSFGKTLVAISLNGVALGAAAWVGWDIWNSGILTGVRPVSATVSPESLDLQMDNVDINTIVRAHLFGTEPKNARPVAPKPVAPTRLNLKLAGVIAIGSENQGIALIEVGRGRQQVVKVGQVIPTTDATLAEVARDHVLIERNAQLEKLSIVRPELEFDPIKSPGDESFMTGDSSGLEHLPIATEEIPIQQAQIQVSSFLESEETAPVEQFNETSEQMLNESLPEASDSPEPPTADSGVPQQRLTLPF
jgi:type II secretory pathway component PulC